MTERFRIRAAIRLHRSLRVALLVPAFSLAESACAQVEQAWVDRFDGAASRADLGKDIGVDANGDVYVLGTTMVAEPDPGLFTNRFLLIQYGAAGDRRWVRTYTDGGNAVARVLAIGPHGSVAVTGIANSLNDWGTIQYDSNGDLLWADVYDAQSSNILGGGQDMVIDGTGNVYITGPELGGAATIKYAANGSRLWVRVDVQPAGAEQSSGMALDVDGSGNVYVGGTTRILGAGDELLVMKYDGAGALLWARTFGQAGLFTQDWLRDLVLDGAGNVLVTGFVGSNTPERSDVVTLKYDPDGNLLWSRTHGVEGFSDWGSRVTADGSGNVVVIGTVEVGVSEFGGLVLEYDPQGSLLWERMISGSAGGEARANDVAVDEAGNVYVTGVKAVVFDSTLSGVYFTAKYDPNGNLVWEQLYDGPSLVGSTARAIAVGADGNVYVTGDSFGDGTSQDVATIRYTQTDVVPVTVEGFEAVGLAAMVELRWRFGAGWRDELVGVRVQRSSNREGPYADRTGLLEPAGAMSFRDTDVQIGPAYWYRIVTLSAPGAFVAAGPVRVETGRVLQTVLEVPRVPAEGGPVEIRFSLADPSAASRLEIIDARGRRLRLLDQSARVAGRHRITWDRRDEAGRRVARGIYFVHLTTENTNSSRKLALVRN